LAYPPYVQRGWKEQSVVAAAYAGVLLSMPEVFGMAEDDRWFTIPQVAEIFEISEIGVRKQVQQGLYPNAYQLQVGRPVWRIPVGTVEEIIAKSGNPPRLVRRLQEALRRHWGEGSEQSEPE